MFRIHKEGRNIILIACLAVFVVGLLLINFAPGWLRIIGGLTLLVLFFLIIYFFRIPNRTLEVDKEGQIIAPADGKVVVIEEVEDTEYLQARCKQISIFMSPLNVHINWYPIRGKVVYKHYHPGKYLVAWHPKSSLENERTTIVLQYNEVNILIRQIAGAMARRIINYSKVGDDVKPGMEMGFIRFGSRVDVLLPVSAVVKVDLNQTVKGGKTVLAQL
ncbi:MAG: phosphatidylserine decarboxylase family protein [Saprospiraceae bacterium]|nr:phosphatidylserine decarboxylase family protein [Saprospiraceae bacterium]